MNRSMIRRRQLGAELRRLRNAADVAMEIAAAELGCTRQRVGYLETGRNVPKKPELLVLLQLYNAVERREELEELRLEGNARGWWSSYKMPEWQSRFVALEAQATGLDIFDVEMIPGLLQTEAYSRRVHEVADPITPGGDVERAVALRAQRQARLHDDESALRLRALVSESAVLRALAEGEVGRDQLDHLCTLARQPNIELLIVPFAAGLRGSITHSYSLLHFDEDGIPPAGYREHPLGGALVDDQAVVAQLAAIWQAVHDVALGQNETIEWITGQTR